MLFYKLIMNEENQLIEIVRGNFTTTSAATSSVADFDGDGALVIVLPPFHILFAPVLFSSFAHHWMAWALQRAVLQTSPRDNIPIYKQGISSTM